MKTKKKKKKTIIRGCVTRCMTTDKDSVLYLYLRLILFERVNILSEHYKPPTTTNVEKRKKVYYYYYYPQYLLYYLPRTLLDRSTRNLAQLRLLHSVDIRYIYIIYIQKRISPPTPINYYYYYTRKKYQSLSMFVSILLNSIK